MSRYLILGLAVLTWSSAIRAEPGAAISRLIDEPVSLLDFGIFRLQVAADRIADEVLTNINSVSIFVRYDWNADEILVTADNLSNSQRPRSSADARELCWVFVNTFRLRLVGLEEIGRGEVERAFSHAGYRRSGFDDEFYKNLHNRVVLACEMYFISEDGDLDGIKGRTRLTEDEIYYTEP